MHTSEKSSPKCMIGERCGLLPWSEDFQDDLVENANNKNVAKYTSDRFPHPYTVQDAMKWLALAQGQPGSSELHLKS